MSAGGVCSFGALGAEDDAGGADGGRSRLPQERSRAGRALRQDGWSSSALCGVGNRLGLVDLLVGTRVPSDESDCVQGTLNIPVAKARAHPFQ